MMRLVLDTNVLLSALMSPASLSAEQAWSARRLRLPTPEEAESLAVPTQERVRLDIHQRVAPGEPLTQGRQHPAGGIVGPSRPDLPLLEQGQLLSQEEVLGH